MYSKFSLKKKLHIILSVIVITAFFITGCVSDKQTATSQEEETTKVEENYPEKNITLSIPFSAGASSDLFARTAAGIAAKELGVQIVPENKPGGGGAVGFGYMVNQPADGYTIASGSNTIATLIGQGDVPFTADDVDCIAALNGEPEALLVKSDSQFKTLDEFIAFAKENPGKVKIGGTGTGSNHHLFCLLFLDKAGIECPWIPYDGGKDAVLALLSNEVDALFLTPSNAVAQIEDKAFTMLGITLTEERAKELGYLSFTQQGIELEGLLWRGYFAPKGIPEDRREKLIQAFKNVQETQEWKDYMGTVDYNEEIFVSGEDLDELFREDIENAKKYFGK